MAVYTEVSFDEAAAFVRQFDLGELESLEPCRGGIENTNYFASTQRGNYVLTLFERLTFEQLPFYLELMRHLAGNGVAAPMPEADESGAILHLLKGKPASIVNKLVGRSELSPTAAHCAKTGDMLARMHVAGQTFARHQGNLRDLDWWNQTAPTVLPHISSSQRSLLLGELAYQNHIRVSSAYKGLPIGAIHGDLFRDNVMFEGSELTGFFDFYFAGCDVLLFDICVCLNDWCIDLASGQHNAERSAAFIAAYEAVRPLRAQERTLLPAMGRAAALRFWISRLWDFYLPREATLLQAHDPAHFERVLNGRVAQPLTYERANLTTVHPS
jgi:homoserine kinase type II